MDLETAKGLCIAGVFLALFLLVFGAMFLSADFMFIRLQRARQDQAAHVMLCEAHRFLARHRAMHGSADRSTRADDAPAHGTYGHPHAVSAARRHALPVTHAGEGRARA